MRRRQREGTGERVAELIAEELTAGASLPIDPYSIAKNRDIEVLATKLEACSGCLVRTGGTFGILYSNQLQNDGFERFTVAHELGHYFIPGHPDALFRNGDGIHESHSGFLSGDSIERQADHFAASLLMPSNLFISAMRRESAEGFKALEALAATCRVSLTAAARRFAEYADDPVAVVMSRGNKLEWYLLSESLRELPGLSWPRKGSLLPRDSATARFNEEPSNVALSRRIESTSPLSDWFDGPYDIEMNEDVVGLGRYGRTLTVLFTTESLADVEDDPDTDTDD